MVEKWIGYGLFFHTECTLHDRVACTMRLTLARVSFVWIVSQPALIGFLMPRDKHIMAVFP
jgi:hypothetical protein